MRLLLVLALSGTFSAFASPSAGTSPSTAPSTEAITAGAIRAHMAFLADDLMEGRMTGSRGYRIAANYVAAHFGALGLAPAGEDGTYFQTVPLRRSDLVSGACSAELTTASGPVALVNEVDLLFGKSAVHESAEAKGPLVYVGYGISAPEFGHDDYAGVDVRGKILVMLRGAPPRFPHNERAFYADTDGKFRTAVARGAVGILTLRKPDPEAQRAPWAKSIELSRIPSMRWLGPDGEPVDAYPEIRVTATLSPEGAAKVFAGSSRSLDEVFAAAEESRPQSFDLGVAGRFTAGSRHAPASCVNVAGLIPGEDPALAPETVVFTAHLDHLGVDPGKEGDGIYNGAYDNASGIAVMLEIARAMVSSPDRPRRSVLFLAVTGEERGLLGSEYFAAEPTVPIEQIVADVNLDMFLMLHPCRDVIGFGAEHSSLGPVLEEVASRLGVRVSPDPVPEEIIFVRSDQYSFVKKGIPSVFLVAGQDAGDGTSGGREMEATWDREIYHSPADDMSQDMDFEAGALFARLNLLLGIEIANREGRPTWNPGDFFGDRFGRPVNGGPAR